MRRSLVLLILVVLLVAVSPTIRANYTPGVPSGEFMGMVVRDPHYEWKTSVKFPNGVNQDFFDTMGQNLERAGVKWVRVEFFADEFAEPGAPDLRGQVNVEKYRYFIEQVAPRHHLKVLALLATPLVRQRPEVTGLFRYPGDTYPAGEYIDPERLDDSLTLDPSKTPECKPYGFTNPYMCIWLQNAFQVAKAFPYNKTTGVGIAAYEVLNEENRYIGGNGKGILPSRVATLMTKFYRTFKQEGGPDGSLGAWRNDVKIILGGLHPDRCVDCGVPAPGMTDRDYLSKIYNLADPRSPFQEYRRTFGTYPLDGVGYHPYPMEMRSGLVPSEPTANPDLFRVVPRVRAIHDVMLQNEDQRNRIWVTEVGDRGAPITVDPPGDNERNQADFMRSIYWNLWQERAYIQNVFWFKYEDFAVPSDPTQVGTQNWGVVRLVPRPADQPCPQPYPTTPVNRQTCEYDVSGTVQRFKLSYTTYKDIAENGLPMYTTYLPIVAR